MSNAHLHKQLVAAIILFIATALLYSTAHAVSRSDCEGLKDIPKNKLYLADPEIVKGCVQAGVDLPAQWRPRQGRGEGIMRGGSSSLITVKSGPKSPPGASNPREGVAGFNIGSLASEVIRRVITRDEIDERLEEEERILEADACGIRGLRREIGGGSGTVPLQCGGTVTAQKEIMTVVPNPTHAAIVDKHIHEMHIFKKEGNRFAFEQTIPLPRNYCDPGGLGDCIERKIYPIAQYFTFNNNVNIMSVELDPEISENIDSAQDFVHVVRNGTSWTAPPDLQERSVTLKPKDKNFAGYHIRPVGTDRCNLSRFNPRTANCRGMVVGVNLDNVTILAEPRDNIRYYEVEGREEVFVRHTATHSLHMSYYYPIYIALGQSLNAAEGGTIQIGDQYIQLNVPNRITSTTAGRVTLSNGGIVTDDVGNQVSELPPRGSFTTSNPIRFFPRGAMPLDRPVFFKTTPDAYIQFPDTSLRDIRDARTRIRGGL